MKKIVVNFLILTLFLFIYATGVFALAYKCETEHFIVYYQKGVDLLDVAYNINIGPSFQFDSPDSSYFKSPRVAFETSLEHLFDEVSDILDMHIYSYKGKLKIYVDKRNLKAALENTFGYNIRFESIYHHGSNTIYISQEGISPGILAHEIAHAIMNHFFVVMPPVKIQEILSGYVEYNIKKKLRGNK